MANIAGIQVLRTNEVGSSAKTDLTTSYKYFEADGHNDILAVYCTAAGTVTIEAGDGVAAMNDITVNVEGTTAAPQLNIIQLDSSAFMHTTGTNKGGIGVKGTATGQVFLIHAI